MSKAEYQREYRKNLRARALMAIGGMLPMCSWEDCREVDDLEFAHTKPTGLNGEGRGMERRYLDVLKNPDKYRLLCKPHHTMFDNN